MTAEIIELMWNARCDWCLQWCLAGTIAYRNPNSKKCYHVECLEKAEVG